MNKKFALILTLISAVFFAHLSLAYSDINTVAWDGLSDKDISPEGRTALSLNKDEWKHAETEHFVYHFTDDKSAETVCIHAEVYYKWIKDFFGIAEDKWSKKSQIFIFTDKKEWDDFLINKLKRKDVPEAFTTGWELFIYRAPHWISPRKSLAHEITHVVVFRFVEGPPPLFLNEGFSDFVSRSLVDMQLDGTGYSLAFLQPLSADEYIPLKDAAEMRAYPDKNVNAFYQEGEWLVKFLSSRYGKEKFYEFLRLAASGEDFQKSIDRVYGIGLDAIEEEFKKYSCIK